MKVSELHTSQEEEPEHTFQAIQLGISQKSAPRQKPCMERLHPRAESFELQAHYLTYKLLRSSGAPQSVVYPTQASGVISTPF